MRSTPSSPVHILLAQQRQQCPQVALKRVVVTDLRQAPFDLDVVKVWVPGLEEYCLVSQYQPGDRAAGWMRHTAPERVGP